MLEINLGVFLMQNMRNHSQSSKFENILVLAYTIS